MKDIVVIVGSVVGVVVLFIGISALFALPVMWLWNYVVPYQFGLKEIDFFHAWKFIPTMKFQGIDYCELRGDKYKYTQPKLKAGDTIKLLYDDETPTVRLGDKRMKRGNYVVTKVDNGFIDNRKAYVLLKNGAKYDYLIYTIAIDKAIEAGVIVVKNS